MILSHSPVSIAPFCFLPGAVSKEEQLRKRDLREAFILDRNQHLFIWLTHPIRMGAATILVVDDDSMFLEVVCLMLLREGYQVLASVSAHQALEIVKKVGSVDVVLSDILMPEMSGVELVREVAALSPNSTSVLMTGGTSRRLGQRARGRTGAE